MIEFILLTLAAYNVTQIISEATIFKPVRIWLLKRRFTSILGELMSCFLCTSVWVCFFATKFVHNIADGMNYSWLVGTMSLSATIWFIHIIERRFS